MESTKMQPQHSVLDLKKFVDANDTFYVLGTGWQALHYRQVLQGMGKTVLAFIKNPMLPPLHPAPLRHRRAGRRTDFVNSLIDHCQSVFEDYHGDRLYGIPVLEPEVVDWQKAKTLVCLENRPLDAVQWLRAHGLRAYQDFIAYPDMIFWPGSAWEPAVGRPFYDYWISHQDNFARARDCFADVASQQLFDKTIRFRLGALELESAEPDDQPESYDRWKRIVDTYYDNRNRYSTPIPFIDQVTRPVQLLNRLAKYFNPFGTPPRIVHRAAWIISSGVFDHLVDGNKLSSGGIILDCGAFEGESSAALHWLSPKATVYAFEPLQEAYDKLHELSRKMPSVIAVKQGTWSSSGRASLSDAGEGSRVSTEGTPTEDSIELISIDEFVTQHKLPGVDSIKMNIEGAEMPSLRGALNTIRRHSPLLSICAEHLPSDLWEIPTYLKQTHPEYQLSFKHFGPHIWASYVVGTTQVS